MATDLEARPEGRELIERADQALAGIGVPSGRLRALMAGDGQAARAQEGKDWVWSGDYPLSSAAQTVVSVAHARHFHATHGEPTALIGESMGELAAYAVAGVLGYEEAIVTTYRWAQALESSSRHAGELRLVLLVMCSRDHVDAIARDTDAEVVIYESINQFCVSVPRARIADLEARAMQNGARALISVQPCSAHDPRMAKHTETWTSYGRWLDQLAFNRPQLEIHSTLDPGTVLSEPDALKHNLLATGVSAIHWAEAISRLFWNPRERPIDRLLQLCSRSDPYVLDRLRPQGIVLRRVRTEAVSTLADVELGGRRADKG